MPEARLCIVGQSDNACGTRYVEACGTRYDKACCTRYDKTYGTRYDRAVPVMTRFVVSLQWLVFPISVSYIKVSDVDLPPAVFLVSSLYKLYTEISIIT